MSCFRERLAPYIWVSAIVLGAGADFASQRRVPMLGVVGEDYYGMEKIESVYTRVQLVDDRGKFVLQESGIFSKLLLADGSEGDEADGKVDLIETKDIFGGTGLYERSAHYSAKKDLFDSADEKMKERREELEDLLEREEQIKAQLKTFLE